jgi:uncharacterized protein (TIGR03067 family)
MRQDLDLLQGTWTITTLELEGEPMPAAMLENACIAIQGNRFTTTGMGAEYAGTLKLDASANPRRLDMKFDTGHARGTINLGIYELKGNKLKLCLATRGAVRPKKFASTPGSGIALETLTRGKAPAAAKSKTKSKTTTKSAPATKNSAPATEIDGEWDLVSAVMDGTPMDQSMVKWVKRVTQGNQSTVTAGPQVMLKVGFTSDTSKSPKTIDYINLAGANKGKAQAGIYEFEGELLKFCVAAPGAARPKKFESAKGDGRALTVWKRA